MDNSKTNVMRILDQKKIAYSDFSYDSSITNGVDVASVLGEDKERVFKTLVTVSNNGHYFVFVIPVFRELDLKKAAKVALVKSIEMIKQKDLLPLTGYIHGGCSPIGMKKLFPTFIDNSCNEADYFYVSGGRCGRQIRINPNDLMKLINAKTADLVKENIWLNISFVLN